MGKKGNADDRHVNVLNPKTSTTLSFEADSFAEGKSRKAFRARVDEGGVYCGYTSGSRLVLKTFKSEYYNKGLQVSEKDVEMQLYCKELADRFNFEMSDFGDSCPIHIRVAAMDYMRKTVKRGNDIVFFKGETFMLEQEIKGTFQKFNSNSGWSAGDDVLDTFSHWTWCETQSVVVCDLQGVKGGPGEPMYGRNEVHYYLLTDPAINSKDKRFGVSDMGDPGIQTFFHKHKCNYLCRAMGLQNYRPQGRQAIPVVRESSYSSMDSSCTSLPPPIFQPSRRSPALGTLQEGDEEDGPWDTSDSDVVLDIDEIHFTHDSIKNQFSCGRWITRTLNELWYGDIVVSDIPMLTVSYMHGKYWAYNGNRRLWVYKQLRDLGEMHQVRVHRTTQRVPVGKMTTRNGGVSVRVRERGGRAWW